MAWAFTTCPPYPTPQLYAHVKVDWQPVVAAWGVAYRDSGNPLHPGFADDGLVNAPELGPFAMSAVKEYNTSTIGHW